jgi:7-cyano-7-deazaguanine synthase
MIMLSIAIGHAIAHKFDCVSYAAHGGDHAIYPDCRPEFIQKMNSVAAICDWHKVYLWTPFIGHTKADIVKIGDNMSVDYAKTWSCYKGGSIHCGTCGTCVERREAFKLAGVPDPTVYHASSELLHHL